MTTQPDAASLAFQLERELVVRRITTTQSSDEPAQTTTPKEEVAI